MLRQILLLSALLLSTTAVSQSPSRLYLVPYAHLDTQWLWTYEDTIDPYLKDTLDQNFALFEKYPDYQFNFTGAFRYKLMKEYWPERYAKLKKYVAAGRWHIAGSSWEEHDVLIPDPESILRQILYGNLFFREEFGKTSVDAMLPDSFGFPASLPTLISHAGLKGFSTQKLSWGAARGIPFNLGIWRGPDGSKVLAALNPGPYDSMLPKDFWLRKDWRERLAKGPVIAGRQVDFRYFGVGDSGGAPRPDDVEQLVAGLREPHKPFEVVAAGSDQFARDFADADLKDLPETEGEFLLVEHSAGILSSNSALKVANRESEHRAAQAELLASIAAWRGEPYPKAKLRKAWETLLATQMHDILGGTAIPKANSHSLNDHSIAQNLFDAVIESSAAAIAAQMDSSGPGLPLLISNTNDAQRQDLAEIRLSKDLGRFTHAIAPDGQEIPLQTSEQEPSFIHYLFPVNLGPMQNAIYSLVAKTAAPAAVASMPVDLKGIESDLFKLTLSPTGDIVSIWNKTEQREELRSPIRYEFLNEFPTKYPAWNMTWKDRKRPPRSYLSTEARISIVEAGPWRSSLKIERRAEGSQFIQIISLVRGRPLIDIEEQIDWRTKDSSLKVAISPSFSAKSASYDMGLSVADRANNSETLFEMPQHQWMAMASENAARGLSVINACCYGSDKPNDGTMRLTLLYTPHSRLKDYAYNASQDWGRHRLRWSIYPHQGNWQSAGTQNWAEQANTPLLAFLILDAHPGPLGKSFNFLKVEGASVKAVKQEEAGSRLILRLADRSGAGAKFRVTYPSAIQSAHSVDGQEQDRESRVFAGKSLEGSIERFGLQSLAVQLEEPGKTSGPRSQALKLVPNAKAFSNRDRSVAATGAFAALSFPIEDYPGVIRDRGVTFELAPRRGRAPDVLQAQGQTIPLPAGQTLHLLAFASRDKTTTLKIDGQPQRLQLACWHGAIGDADRRVLDKEQKLLQILPGFRKSPSIAAFAQHTHGKRGNLPYYPNYLFHYILPAGKVLTLPDDPDVYIAAISSAQDARILPLTKGQSR